MRTTFAAQLAQLEIGSLSVQSLRPEALTDLPSDEAAAQTLAGIWSDLFALFPETAIEWNTSSIPSTVPSSPSSGQTLTSVVIRSPQPLAREETREIQSLRMRSSGSSIRSSAPPARKYGSSWIPTFAFQTRR